MRVKLILLLALATLSRARHALNQSTGKGIEVATGYNVDIQYEPFSQTIILSVVMPNDTWFELSFIKNFTYQIYDVVAFKAQAENSSFVDAYSFRSNNTLAADNFQSWEGQHDVIDQNQVMFVLERDLKTLDDTDFTEMLDGNEFPVYFEFFSGRTPGLQRGGGGHFYLTLYEGQLAENPDDTFDLLPDIVSRSFQKQWDRSNRFHGGYGKSLPSPKQLNIIEDWLEYWYRKRGLPHYPTYIEEASLFFVEDKVAVEPIIAIDVEQQIEMKMDLTSQIKRLMRFVKKYQKAFYLLVVLIATIL